MKLLHAKIDQNISSLPIVFRNRHSFAIGQTQLKFHRNVYFQFQVSFICIDSKFPAKEKPKSTVAKYDKREVRIERFEWLKVIGNKGYFCFGCKKLIPIVNLIKDIPCTGKCSRSLNFGNPGDT